TRCHSSETRGDRVTKNGKTPDPEATDRVEVAPGVFVLRLCDVCGCWLSACEEGHRRPCFLVVTPAGQWQFNSGIWAGPDGAAHRWPKTRKPGIAGRVP